MPARARQAVAPRGIGVAIELLVADDAVDRFHLSVGPLAHAKTQTALAGSAPAVRITRVAPPVVTIQRESVVADAASFRHHEARCKSFYVGG